MPRAFAIREKRALRAEFQNHLLRAKREQFPRNITRVGQFNMVAGGANQREGFAFVRGQDVDVAQ